MSKLFKEVRKLIYIIVGIAGILGALSRYYLGLTIHEFWYHTFPLATLLINLAGCFLLAWLTTYIAKQHLAFRNYHRHRDWIHRFLYDVFNI